MQNKTVHIAFCLGLIFLFPLIYQPMHVLFHYHEDNHYHCVAHHIYPNLSHGNTGEAQNQEIEKEVYKCLVCGYEFTSFNLSNGFFISYYSDDVIIKNDNYKQKEILSWCGTNKSLRAPPVLSI